MKYAYWFCSALALSTLVFEAPRGQWLTSKPERGRVEQSKDPIKSTARGRGAMFLWLGAGYHGGK